MSAPRESTLETMYETTRETTYETKSTCCYCGVGCGVVIQSDGRRITGVRGDPDHPANFGKLCTKGSTLHLTAAPATMAARARYPELRRSRGDSRSRVTWDEAMNFVVQKFAATIQEHDPNSVAFYISGQLLTEDYYVFNKLAKGLIGTNNVDTNSRLCMSSAVSGYVKTLGVDAPPCNYEDIGIADCLFIAGSNMAFAHPILFRRIEAARDQNPNLKIVVVDPRQTDTARFADLHLAILPGSDVALFHAMLHVMLWEGLTDQTYIAAHTEGFEALRTIVRDYSPQAAVEICGVKADDIVTAARWFAQSKATLSLYCQGLNQSSSGTAKNATLINLHLATGQIGKAGAGPFSLTGQPNAMGGREVGGLATMLAAHRDIDNAEHRAEMEQLWGVEKISPDPGMTAVEMFDAVKRGEVKAIWIACTNPAQSLPDLPQVRAALEKAELVVLQEAYANTETAAFADVLLPATGWGEKSGTVTNSERRISRVRSATPRPFEARHDWEIVRDFAQRLETKLRPGKPTLFPYATPESIWNEHRETTRGRDLDITGLSYALLESNGPQQWPFPEGATQGTARLYEDGVFHTPSGRARFYDAQYKPVAEAVDARFPFRLTTGRMRDHWHGMSRTGTVASLFGHAPEPRLGMNPGDMARRNFKDGSLVRVDSRRGALHVIVEGDESVRSGQAYLPMHWGKRFLGGKGSDGINTITMPAFDPISRQPELKHAAIKVSAVDLPWRMVAFAELEPDQVTATLDKLQHLQNDFAFASAVLIGRDRPGVLLRAANDAPPAPEWFAAFDMLMGLESDETLSYDDARRNSSRRIRVVDDRLLAVRLAGEEDAIASGEWLKDWLVGGKPIAEIRRLLLSPATHAPSGFILSSRVICQCWNVSEDEIAAALTEIAGDPALRMARLQTRLKCGTNCGSCAPELRQLLAKCPAKSDAERKVA